MPEEIYKAMIVAYQNGIISTETRWDEAATLSESLELLVKAILNEKGLASYTAKLGSVSGYEVEIKDNTSESLDETTTFEGNGAGQDVIIPEDFPYVDREEEPKQEEQVEQKEQVVEQPVQQPVSTQAPQQPVNPMPGGTMGDVTWGTPGTGMEHSGDFGTFQ